MRNFIIIVVLVILFSLSGVTSYYLYDYLKYKSSFSSNLISVRDQIRNEENARLSTYKSVVDQMNLINNDIYTKVNKSLSSTISLSDNLLPTMSNLIQVVDENGNYVPFDSTYPSDSTINMINTMNSSKGISVKNLDRAGNNFTVCGRDNGFGQSNCMVLPDAKGNTIIKNIDAAGDLIFKNNDLNKNIILDGNPLFNNNLSFNYLNLNGPNVINNLGKNQTVISTNGDLVMGSTKGDYTTYGNNITLNSSGGTFSIAAGKDIVNNEISLMVDENGNLNLYKPINFYDPISKKKMATIDMTSDFDLHIKAENNIVLNTGVEVKNIGEMEVDQIKVTKMKGSILPPGPIGSQGSQGIAGPAGAPGTIKGPTGSQGVLGLTGFAGLDGRQGNTGSTGPRGINGESGPIGIQGFPGLKDIGPRGPLGSIGIKGEQGSQGDINLIQGSQGPLGSIGTKGSLGIGIQGNQGSIGPLGSKSITQGGVGSQGEQGNIGSLGQKGSQGIVGLIGLRGDMGAKGSVGPLGSRGPQGSIMGERGPQGFPTMGRQGERGPQGRIGIVCDNQIGGLDDTGYGMCPPGLLIQNGYTGNTPDYPPTPAYCQSNPNDPQCPGNSAYCQSNPNDPLCIAAAAQAQASASWIYNNQLKAKANANGLASGSSKALASGSSTAVPPGATGTTAALPACSGIPLIDALIPCTPQVKQSFVGGYTGIEEFISA